VAACIAARRYADRCGTEDRSRSPKPNLAALLPRGTRSSEHVSHGTAPAKRRQKRERSPDEPAFAHDKSDTTAFAVHAEVYLAGMVRRRSRVAALEDRVRGLVGMPRLLRTHPVSMTVSMPWESLTTIQAGVSAPWESEARRGGSSRVSGGGTVKSRGYKSSEEQRRDRIAETGWLIATTTFGAGVAELLVPTRESAVLGALIGLAWGVRTWRSR
jgi:hypothetical protein